VLKWKKQQEEYINIRKTQQTSTWPVIMWTLTDIITICFCLHFYKTPTCIHDMQLTVTHILLQLVVFLTLLFYSRTHTTHKCWPTCLPTVLENKSVVCSKSFMLANNVGHLRTCSFFVGLQAANCVL